MVSFSIPKFRTYKSSQGIPGSAGKLAVDFKDLHAGAHIGSIDEGDSSAFRTDAFQLHAIGKQRQRFALNLAAVYLSDPKLLVFRFVHPQDQVEQHAPLM